MALPPPPPGFQIDTPPPGFQLDRPIIQRGEPPKTPTPQTPEQREGTNLNNQGQAYSNQSKPVYDRFGAMDKLTDNVRNDKRIIAYESAVPVWASALNAPETPEGDVLLVNAFAKVNDPSTGVQQREGAEIQNSAPTFEQWKARALKEFGGDAGGNFSPEGRQRLKAAVTARMQALTKSYRGARDEWRKRIVASGVPDIDPEVILGDFAGRQFQQDAADYIHRPVSNKDGSIGAMPKDIRGAINNVPLSDVPFDPNGEGSIGFMAPKGADALPPGAQGWQRDVTRGIQAGIIRNGADVAALAKTYGFEAPPDVIRNWDSQLKQIQGGARFEVPTPQYPKPDISDVRGQGGFMEGADAFMRGAADTPTFGLVDKGTALIDALTGGGGFRENLARQYAISDYDMENNFVPRLSGQIAGGFALPMGEMNTLRQAVTKSAGMGAGYGLGSSREVGDIPGNVIGGGLAGGTLGAAVHQIAPYAVRSAAALGRRIAGPITPEQQALVQASIDEQVPINMGDLFPGARNTIATLETIPGASGPVRQGIQAGSDAIEGRVQALGLGGTARDDVGQVVQDSGHRYIARTRNIKNSMYQRAEQLAGDATIPPQNTMQTLAQLVRTEREVPGGTRAQGVLEEYARAFENGGPMTVRGARKMRSELRARLRDEGQLTVGDADRLTNQVMDAVSTDITNALTLAGRGNAVRAYQRADAFYRQRQTMIDDVVRRFTGTREKPMSAEQTLAVVERMAKPKGGDERRLAQMLRTLDPDERADVAATFAAQLGRRSPEEPFSPATLVQNARNISPAARATIFGADGARSIQNLVNLSTAKREAVNRLNNSRSGQVSNYRTVLSSLLFGMPGGGAVMGAAAGLNFSTGAVGGAAIAGGGIAGARGLSRVLMNPNFTRLLAQAPATRNPAAINNHVGAMRRMALQNPELRGVVEQIERSLMNSANDNAMLRSAASPGGEQQEDQRNR